jgi:hypothetical protein
MQSLQLFAKIDSLFCKKKGDDNTQKAATILYYFAKSSVRGGKIEYE